MRHPVALCREEMLLALVCDGGRPLPLDRDALGRLVREAWVRWAESQPNPKASWLVPYDELCEAGKEADRQIGETIARWTIIHDAAAIAGAARSAETNEDLAQSEGQQSGPKGIAQ